MIFVKESALLKLESLNTCLDRIENNTYVKLAETFLFTFPYLFNSFYCFKRSIYLFFKFFSGDDMTNQINHYPKAISIMVYI